MDVLRGRFGVENIALFGSCARKQQGKNSDVDIAVNFAKPVGLLFFELWDYLEQILGIKVDLTTFRALKGKPLLWRGVRGDLLYV